MGIATLWVMLYHSGIMFTAVNGTGIRHYFYILSFYLYSLKTIGQISVDIFLFLSAIGLFFSMEKDDDIFSFYMRRVKRILPEYLIVNLAWGILNAEPIGTMISNISGFSFISEGYRGNWYFILLFFLYLVFPFLYRFVKKYGNFKVLFIFAFVLLFNYAFSIIFSETFVHIEIALRRIPVFLLGLSIAESVKNGRKINGFAALLLAVIILIFSYTYIISDEHFMNAFYRYVSGLNGISIIFLISYFCSQFKTKTFVTKIMGKCGSCSMECYLLYEKILKLLARFTASRVLIALSGAVLCFVLAKLLKEITKRFS